MTENEYFTENGYIILENVISEKKIDFLLTCLEKFKQKKHSYYSQSLSKWVKPEIDNYGFMVQSMENFTRLFLSSGLANAGNNIVLSDEILSCLQKIKPEYESFALWQNMLFDRSTGTTNHQDSWYLDTNPKGNLIAIWIALEDINEKCGPFKVYPKSHKFINPNDLENLSSQDFLQICNKYAKENKEKKVLIKKGSVLFWHPSTIHGSDNQIDSSFSRKSITAHYYPLGSVRQIKNSKFNLKRHLKDLNRTRNIADLPIYVGYSKFDVMLWNIKGFIKAG